MRTMVINIILVVILGVILGAAVLYIVKSLKSGKKCIGCPDGCSCNIKNKKSNDSCGCCNVDLDIKNNKNKTDYIHFDVDTFTPNRR